MSTIEAQITVPFDVDIEQALLGACMGDEGALSRAELEPEDFYDPLHHQIWHVIEGKRATNDRCTPFTVHAALSDNEMMKSVGGRAYLVSLTRAASGMPNIEGYAKTLRDLAARRQMIVACEQAIDEASGASLDTDAHDLLAQHESNIRSIQMGKPLADDPATWDAIGADMIDKIGTTERANWNSRLQPYGIHEIDNAIGGMGPGDLIIIGARPGMGKTALALAMAHNAARPKEQISLDLEPAAPPPSVGVFMSSLEMERRLLFERGISMEAFAKGIKVPYANIRLGRIQESQASKLADVYMEARGLPFEIDDRRGLTVSQIGIRMRRAKARFTRMGVRLGLGIIDHLGLIEPDGNYRGNKVAELTATTKALKVLAGALGFPLVVLCQLTRAVDSREDKRPYLSDLRDSGSIEQDADVVILVHRPEYYLRKSKPDADAPAKERDAWQIAFDKALGKLNLSIAKNRNGPEADITLRCDMAYNSIGGA